jgi:hypothetical protein
MKLLLFLLLFFSVQMCAHDGIFIVIHGTWAIESSWWKPGGKFFSALEYAAKAANKKVIPFTWNGKLDHESRIIAGTMLTHIIQSYPKEMKIYIIGHSHGSNVGILASQMLGNDPQNQHKIEAFYALGTPVDIDAYMPNMNIISRFYNLYSHEDKVQPVLGFYERTYPSHPRIANIRVFLECKEPSHKELLSTMIASWLPKMHEDLAKEKMGNFHHFNFSRPGVIQFSSTGIPIYGIEVRKKEIE